jgi:hypothetical protein
LRKEKEKFTHTKEKRKHPPFPPLFLAPQSQSMDKGPSPASEPRGNQEILIVQVHKIPLFKGKEREIKTNTYHLDWKGKGHRPPPSGQPPPTVNKRHTRNWPVCVGPNHALKKERKNRGDAQD